MIRKINPNYRWYILGVTMITNAFVTGTARLSMPVLFKEISDNLGLTVTQVGTIWGMDPLAGIFIGLPGGLLADRFGVKRTAAVVCILAGIFGALRGISGSFISLAFLMFLFGLTAAAIPSIVPKVIAERFGGRQMGLAMALMNIAWGIWAMAATMFSATALSPFLGSWRWVMLFYGVPCVLLGLVWLTTREPNASELTETIAVKVPFKEAISRVVRMKDVWLLGIMTTFIWGASMGLIGYLPLYLRNIGWTPTSADSVITIFSGVGSIGVMPMVLLSDKIKSRKTVMLIAIVSLAATLGLLPVVNTTGVWLLVGACAFLRSGVVLFYVMILEIKGVGSTYGGTASGLANTVSMVGAFLAPPLGNSLARIDPGYPFFLWSGMAVIALLILLFIKNRSGQA